MSFSGITVVIGGLIGSVLGGVLIKRFSLTALAMIRIEVVASIAAAVLMVATLLHCDSVQFAGVNTDYANSSIGYEICDKDLYYIS